MPPKRSKTARSATENKQRPLRIEDERKQPAASRGSSAKRSAANGEEEPARRRGKKRVKPQLVATVTNDLESKKTHHRDTTTKERLPKRKRHSTDADTSPLPAVLAVAKEPVSNNTKRRKKKRVQPQLIQAQSNRNSTAVIAAEIVPPLHSFQQQQATPENPRQRWTELTAVGHILADEVVKYSRDNASVLSDGEMRQLHSWSKSVQHRIYHKSTLVLENTVLAADLKKGQKAVESIRDEMTVLRARTKRFRDEADELEGNVEEAMKETSALQGATTFLTALQSLAAQAME